LCGFKISQSFTGSTGGILSLTCSKYSTRNIGISCQPNFALPILYHLLTFWKGLSWKPLLLDRTTLIPMSTSSSRKMAQ
jgi:hypothetical protein